ncbi:MAG: Coenzyme F420 hydrogenase/dehydrogenase, beta subunit C-terminal domain [Oscillospiraceae bacterium]|nr:Coenzyme F420 hydrogenase/dehydrogenase, beta subunit C-terminal domain [Oscillospiraceae bacterium]
MKKIVEKHLCSGCHACASVCPKQCIEMKVDNEGFLYPEIDETACIDCGKCKQTCPVLKNEIKSDDVPKAYAMYNKNEDIRLKSSSGGVFALLAEQTLSKGGIVFGAAFTDGFRAVKHIAVESLVELPRLMGSKYLQSEIGDSYVRARKYLEDGRQVLFTGTPCQISGLYAYLNKDYDNLFTQDIICHGVPSPMVWEKYVKFREAQAASTTRRTFFRHKKYGWKTFSVQFEFTNCTEYVQDLSKDLYMRGFLVNLFLRPSCHNCSFKQLHRQSDLTIADFWGVQNILPEFDDDKGTSLVIVHSHKGEQLLEQIKDNLIWTETNTPSAVSYNSAMLNSVAPHPKREEFFNELDTVQFDSLINKYAVTKRTVKSIGKSVLRKIKKLVK